MSDHQLQTNTHAVGFSKWAPLALFAFALIYFGLYTRYWFSLTDEGGTGAVVAMRILAGERPLRDVFLGYNVLWFYPIAALFKITGPNFIAMRIYFFSLSTLAGLAGYSTVRTVTGRGWLGFLAGTLMIVYPGMQFKNYIPAMAALNTWALVRAFRRDEKSRWWIDAMFGGILLGLTFLIRIDLGIFFSVMWLGALTLRLFDQRASFFSNIRRSMHSLAVVMVVAVALQVPFYLVAKAQGFERPFAAQYAGWYRSLSQPVLALTHRWGAANKAAARPKPVNGGTKTDAAIASASRDTRPRATFSVAAKSPHRNEEMALVVLTYAPLALFGIFVTWSAVTILSALLRREFRADGAPALLLMVLGGSLTAFPQFFFFRPDRPHLSEFMVNGLAAIVCCAGFVVAGKKMRSLTWWRQGLLALLVFHASLFGWFAMQHPSAGTIAARMHRPRFFAAENGVRVFVTPGEFADLDGIRRAVLANSKSADYVVCYPYQPGINLMTNRRTYEHNLYYDNATKPHDFDVAAIARIREKKPAVVVINDRAINQVEDSRFSRWSPAVMQYVRDHYRLTDTFAHNDIFVRNEP